MTKCWFWELFQKCSIFQNIWPIQLRGSGRVLRLSCFSFVYIENIEWILLSNTFLRKIFSFMAQQFSLALVFLNLWLFLFHIIHFHLGKIASFCPDPSDKYPQASAGLKANLKVVAAQIREWQREKYIFKQYFQLQIQTKRHFYWKNGMGWMESYSLDCYNFYSGTKKRIVYFDSNDSCHSSF